jgi:hypothetical protein
MKDKNIDDLFIGKILLIQDKNNDDLFIGKVLLHT